MALNRPFSIVRPDVPLVEKHGDGPPNQIGKDWYVLVYNLYNGVTAGLNQPVAVIAATASPMTYRAVVRGQMIVSGGTISAIALSRDGTTFYATGLTAGVFPMCAADSIRITYTVTPTVLTFFPM